MRDWADKIAAGDIRALARAASVIENRGPETSTLLRELAPQAGRAVVVGVTGPPGAGKSTLVDALARLIRRQAKTLGIIAVDPTSNISGGAILGDRIRMQAHHNDPGVFIRSMATRGYVGGLARATADLALLLASSGKDFVIIETIGVGQDEVEVANVADVTALVLVPGMGDDVQAIKAGIMEIADIFVINKADHPGAERVEQEIEGVLSLGHRPDGWMPPIVHTVATEEKGIDALLDAIEKYAALRRDAGVTNSTGAKYQLQNAESDLAAGGFTCWTLAKSRFRSVSNVFSVPPRKTFARKVPPGFSTSRDNSFASNDLSLNAMAACCFARVAYTGRMGDRPSAARIE